MSAAADVTMTSEAMPVGGGLTVTFRMQAGRLEAEWQPRIPYGRKARKYLPAYKRARDEFIGRLARRTGLNVLVVDL